MKRDPPLGGEGFTEALGRRSARSGLVRIGGQAVNVVLMAGTAVVLARLLTPRDFGLFAMANTLLAFAVTIKDWGFPMAIVHRETIDHAQVSALFWLTIALNAAAAAFMALAAPLVAWFYGEPRLTPITIAMAAGLFGLSLGYQHESLLMRRLRFGSLALIESGALTAGLAAAIAAAWRGAGAWALVVQFLVYGLARSAGAWVACGWRPALPGRRRAAPDLRGLLAYGGHYTGFRTLQYAGRTMDRVLLGYFRGATAVGLYDSAFRWSHRAILNVYPPLLGVAVASFSRLRHDPERYRTAIVRGLRPVLTAILPALAFLSLEAPRLIPVVFGERWLGAVVPFRLLCLSAMATSLTRVTTWLYLSRGETRRQLRWTLITTPFLILAATIGVRWGATGVALAVTIVTWLLAYPTLAYCIQGTPIAQMSPYSAWVVKRMGERV